MSDAAPRFQFSLADVFVALVSLVYPAVIVSRIDIEELDQPAFLAVAVGLGLLLGFFLPIHFRRLWNSRSIWFLPPFLFFFWSLFFMPYVGQWGSYDWFGWMGVMFWFPPVFCTFVVGVWNHKKGGQHTVIAGVGGFLLGFLLSGLFLPSLVTPRRAVNEWTAASQLKALSQAQEIYKRYDYDKDGKPEYSATFRGLFETKPGAADLAFIDRAMADADATLSSPQPKMGYLFRLLTTSDANLQDRNSPWFDADGNLIRGYAFVAFPAQYRRSGRLTFLMSSSGNIYQKDLGPQTESIVKAITAFDPDTSWTKLGE